ncbi:hypothetical protein O0I10_009921 [Lichtheimia ornata]|uniref:Major facilitator superfamily (MFS) profile domain-containing protein n=1 Tax=Lichtheimia ornata TaxID=688661 RepID=A0AAD7XVB5_9FUNG|nr:uncharacterized protein O0I10_009921 [Lichtheimia ornata]KAJ8654353.1 hypothetical protein O0I10_009921 [Lichtheimia ornata]
MSSVTSKDSNEFQHPPPPVGRGKGVYLSAIVAAIGGFLSGYDTGATSGVLTMEPFVNRFFSPENLAYLQGLMLAFFLMTAALAAFCSGPVCDRLSRKYSVVLSATFFCIGNMFMVIGYNYGLFLAGRLVAGIGAGLMTNAIPLYHSEIAPPEIRGRLISFFTLMSLFGQVVGYFITFGTSHLSTDWSWRAPYMMQCLLAVIFGLSMLPMPYSPRWLVYRGRQEEALASLVSLRDVDAENPIIKQEYQEIVDELEFEKSLGKRSYLELFERKNRKQFFSALFVGIGTAFLGTVAISYFAPQIFQAAGLSDVSSSIAATGGTGLLSLVLAGVSLQWLVDSLGRRILFITGAGAMGVSMFIVGAIFQVYTQVDPVSGDVSITNTNATNTIIAFIYLFTGFYALTWGITTYVYPSEVFNMRVRAKGMSLCFGFNWGFTILITYCMPLFLEHTVSGVYFFFGACCIVCMVGAFFLPETKCKPLEEMDSVFGTK